MSAYALPSAPTTDTQAATPRDDVHFGTYGLEHPPLTPAPAPVPPPRLSPAWLDDQGPILDTYGHYADGDDSGGLDAVTGGIAGFFERLAKRDGVQIDKDGIGGSTKNTRFRFLPIIPYVTD